MSRIFKVPFATQGDTEEVPVDTQGDGSVSFTQGFGFDYEREYEDPASKDIRREVMNGLLHDVTEAVGDIQLSGVAKWDAAAAPYPSGAVVWHNNISWRSRAGNNSAEPSEGESWSRLLTASEVWSGYVPQSRTITAGAGLTGGGDLSANRQLAVNFGTAAGTVAQGNDSRLSDAREWTAATVGLAEAQAGGSTVRRAWTAQRVHQAFGEFGIGGFAPFPPNNNLNTQEVGRGGIYATNPDTVGGSGWGIALSSRWDPTGGAQLNIAVAGASAGVHYRGFFAGVWGPPIRLAESRDLGTMATRAQGTGGAQFRTNDQNDARFLSKSGGEVSGPVTVVQSLYVDSPGNRNLWFRTGDGLSAGLLYSNANDDSINLRAYDTGTNTFSQFSVKPNGDITSGQFRIESNGNIYGGVWGGGGLAALINSKQDNLGFVPVPQGRAISAGTGLSGGGNLTANRTISMNAGQLMNNANVRTQTASSAVGAVGTYAMLVNMTNEGSNPGEVRAGGDFHYSSALGRTVIGGTPIGTWRCMGISGSQSNDISDSRVTLWLRIS